MWAGGGGDRTANLAISGQPALLCLLVKCVIFSVIGGGKKVLFSYFDTMDRQ